MKATKAILIILMFNLGFVNNAIGQVLTEEENHSPQGLYDFHINKMKSNKTAGWIALGGGVVMLVVGVAINITENIFDDSSEGLVLAGFGLATTLASIPLFAAGRKHKNKAEIQLQNGTIGFNHKYNYSGISISLSF